MVQDRLEGVALALVNVPVCAWEGQVVTLQKKTQTAGTVGAFFGRPARGRFLLSAIAAPFIGTTRTSAFLKIAYFCSLSKGSKRFAVSAPQGYLFSGNGGSPHRKTFDRKSSPSTSPAQRNLFLIGLISVLPVDFLDGLLQGLEFCRPVLEDMRRNDFRAELVVFI